MAGPPDATAPPRLRTGRGAQNLLECSEGTTRFSDFPPASQIAEYLALDIADPVLLEAHGITPEARMRAGDICRAKIATCGRTWLPFPTGQEALVVACWHHGAPLVTEGEVAVDDLLAFSPTDPGSYWLRWGHGGVLGAEQFDEAMATGAPVKLHDSPLEWLKSGCEGVVLLDYLEGADV